MNIVITGGTGLIGRHLIPRLLELGHQITVVTRNPQKASSVLGPRVTLWQGLADQSNLNGVDAVINLAGEPIADKRWTHEQKERLCQSRWNITQKLVDLINASDTPPSVLISGSATGYYGDLGEVVVTEEEPPHNEFTHKLCARWEEIACRAQSDKTRVCLLRTGVVLAPDGGILGKMLPPFRLGLGGPIGHLIPRLLELGHQITVVTRNPQKASSVLGPRVTLWQGLADQSNLNGVDAVINLAGEPIADKRWTHEQKERLCQSRWNITQKLVDLINASDTPPSVLISGSATGYYGDLGEVVVTEEEPPHNEFTHKLCARWEEIACRAQSDKTRVCLLRTGVVLAPDGGILGKMLPPFRLGLGGPIGSGRQYLAWIHIDDMVNGILWLLDNELRGPFNMVSPYPVRNEQFAHALGHALHRPAILRVPATAIRLLMGESSVLVLGGQRALPKRLEEAGFAFRWYDLEEALADVVR